MKRTVIAFFALFSIATLADFGAVGRSTSLDGTGAVQAGSVEKQFINCKNTYGSALEDGDVVIADVSNDDGYSCTATVTAGSVPLCVLDEACAASAMCKCQTYGLKTNVNFDVSNENATAGNEAFISEVDAGSIWAEAVGSYAISDRPVGVFYDSVSATGDVELFIRLR